MFLSYHHIHISENHTIPLANITHIHKLRPRKLMNSWKAPWGISGVGTHFEATQWFRCHSETPCTVSLRQCTPWFCAAAREPVRASRPNQKDEYSTCAFVRVSHVIWVESGALRIPEITDTFSSHSESPVLQNIDRSHEIHVSLNCVGSSVRNDQKKNKGKSHALA